MKELTRRSVLAAAGIGFATAGCLTTDGPGDDTTDPTTDDPTDTSPSPEGSDDADTETTIGTGITPGVNEPKADHDVSLTNNSSAERDVRVTVTRKSSDEVVFEETLTVAADSEREVYNLEQADPDGVEAFTVCGEIVEPTTDDTDVAAEDCATVETSACYGDAYVTVDADGELQVIYAVC